MRYADTMETIVKVFELVGVAILVVGGLFAFGVYFVRLLSGAPRQDALDRVRFSLGRAILLGLEVLVVADIIRTIVVTPTLASAATLGVIVIVRVLLSFAIDIEVDGVLPWRRRDQAAPTAPRTDHGSPP